MGQSGYDFLEEAADEQTGRPVRRQSPALEVVDLVFVERTHRGGVAAYHVVAQDLEVGDRVRFGTIG